MKTTKKSNISNYNLFNKIERNDEYENNSSFNYDSGSKNTIFIKIKNLLE